MRTLVWELSPEWADFPEEGSVLCSGRNKEHAFQSVSEKPGCDGLYLGFGPEAFGDIPPCPQTSR